MAKHGEYEPFMISQAISEAAFRTASEMEHLASVMEGELEARAEDVLKRYWEEKKQRQEKIRASPDAERTKSGFVKGAYVALSFTVRTHRGRIECAWKETHVIRKVKRTGYIPKPDAMNYNMTTLFNRAPDWMKDLVWQTEIEARQIREAWEYTKKMRAMAKAWRQINSINEVKS